MNSDVTLKFKSFEASVLYFNGMYKLPIAAFPSGRAEIEYQWAKNPTMERGSNAAMLKRLSAFKKILLDEVSEVDEIIDKVSDDISYSQIEFLTDMADWLGDIQVYCACEMARLGIPLKETLEIIMQSNFSKLGEDGQPIISEGKVQKGPGYWKPEPRIKAMLEQKIAEAQKQTGE